ncbi:MAG: GMP synthase [Saprospiraceae bacterium]|jgi:GMP synthase-like glutamine amidotransferase|nr:GMP synthase [Saprospiraceae bacterium]MBK7437198.1 GMP synthase [Saprospiraceae bacterium]MBK9931352.1 GMP synthase [Saprospiraceae bacterium]MBL0111259.1 GMP synthase [Saprospiraceae bacterium]MBP7922175.1 GMP synthase [Saprospiraceae bacterium]
MLALDREGIRIAILDLYNGEPNEGIRCIYDLIESFSREVDMEIVTDTFAIRYEEEVPDLSYDIYISSGGPGSPLDTQGMPWDSKYFELIDSIEASNKLAHTSKKFVFFICHSFQMICRHYDFAEISQRHPSSYGIMPVKLTVSGRSEPIFDHLPDSFYAADFRMYQVIRPDVEIMDRRGFTLLAEETTTAPDTHDRALMAIRFSDYFIGTQFHPEADPAGMLVHFNGAKKQPIIQNVGQLGYDEMMDHLRDPLKLARTRSTVLPNFLRMAAAQLELV